MPTLSEPQLEPLSLDELLSIPVEDIGQVDIGRANLLCADGLPEADSNEFPGYYAQLDKIAEAVEQYTERS